jgi:succinate dehydrogenase flavin-adding protein (antitoxin of CptAB toxin-antitoxin module)
LAEISHYRALQTVALADFLNKSHEYQKRHIMRWFSITFHTPLIEVEELEFDYILQHYYEHTFENMEKDQLSKEIKDLSMTEDESSKIVEEDDEFVEELIRQEAAKANKVQNPTQNIKDVVNPKSLGISKADLEKFQEIELTFDTTFK